MFDRREIAPWRSEAHAACDCNRFIRDRAAPGIKGSTESLVALGGPAPRPLANARWSASFMSALNGSTALSSPTSPSDRAAFSRTRDSGSRVAVIRGSTTRLSWIKPRAKAALARACQTLLRSAVIRGATASVPICDSATAAISPAVVLSIFLLRHLFRSSQTGCSTGVSSLSNWINPGMAAGACLPSGCSVGAFRTFAELSF